MSLALRLSQITHEVQSALKSGPDKRLLLHEDGSCESEHTAGCLTVCSVVNQDPSTCLNFRLVAAVCTALAGIVRGVRSGEADDDQASKDRLKVLEVGGTCWPL